MIAAALALIASWLPTLAVGAGPLGILAGIVSKFAPNWRTWLRIGAIIFAVIAIAGAGAHYANLRNAAADLRELQPKIAALEESLGCPSRAEAEQSLFECIPARDRDAAQARATAARAQQEAAARAQDELQRAHDALAHDLEIANAYIDAAESADDGVLPKVMLDNWARQRARMGVK